MSHGYVFYLLKTSSTTGSFCVFAVKSLTSANDRKSSYILSLSSFTGVVAFGEASCHESGDYFLDLALMSRFFILNCF